MFRKKIVRNVYVNSQYQPTGYSLGTIHKIVRNIKDLVISSGIKICNTPSVLNTLDVK